MFHGSTFNLGIASGLLGKNCILEIYLVIWLVFASLAEVSCVCELQQICLWRKWAVYIFVLVWFQVGSVLKQLSSVKTSAKLLCNLQFHTAQQTRDVCFAQSDTTVSVAEKELVQNHMELFRRPWKVLSCWGMEPHKARALDLPLLNVLGFLTGLFVQA